MSAAQRLCTFRLGARPYALPVEAVVEIVRRPPIAPVPLAPDPVRGAIHLRGQILLAIDPRRCLDLPADPEAGEGFLIVVRGQGDPVGLLVDDVGDVIDAPDAGEPASQVPAGAAAAAIRSVHPRADGLVVALDLERLLSQAGAAPASSEAQNRGDGSAPPEE